MDIRAKKSVDKFVADRWAFGDDEVIEVNAKDLAEVLLILESTQRALVKSNDDLAFLRHLSKHKVNYTIDLKSLYA